MNINTTGWNPGRDIFFGGDQQLWDIFGAVVLVGSSVVGASAGMLGRTTLGPAPKSTGNIPQARGLNPVQPLRGVGRKPLNNTELRNIGNPGNNSGIRHVQGNASDARTFFNNQVNPSTIREVKPGVFVGQNGNGVTFTYRGASKSGPPTIDVNGVDGLRKIKFLGE